ncbi:NAD(P)H-dependent flavin oxidoreductase [Undibacterium terreum]|uniref:Nitronate monooxygenase n=1 Tax=Undibacterium terreum TaxID=1224302 RepID=A0A916ULT3_9BURK|nr:nitronate monooxygenase [Undibacterium terreum]GGC77543.1 hypothetical protein GCM10011396_25890 [Undibacterium terreum]
MSNLLMQRLGLRHPIIQAPMAGSSTPRMAAAASNSGALGSVALGASNASQARELLAQTRALTDRPFSVNFFAHTPAKQDAEREARWMEHLQPFFAEYGVTPRPALKEIYQSFVTDTDMQQLMLQERPAAVSFHFGLPSRQIINDFKKAGIFLMATATSLSEARQIEAAGIDAIVAQGAEAGGHRGVFDSGKDEGIGTFALVRLIAHNTRVPVIAAGGIMDGQGIAAAMLLGASAAQLGTAFLLTPESAASEGYRAMLKSSRAEHTQITNTISGRGARGMVNRMMTEVGKPGSPPQPDYPIAYDAGKQLHAAASAQGSQEFGALWAGQAAPLIRELGTADLIQALAIELQQARRSI